MSSGTMPSRTGSRDPHGTRRTVLDATETLIGERGDSFALADVAAAAGISKSGLMHHFETRDALLYAVAEDAIQRFRDDVHARIDLSENRPGKILRAYVRTMCDYVVDEPFGVARLRMYATLHAVPGVSDLFGEDFGYWKSSLAADGLHPDRLLLVQLAVDGLDGAFGLWWSTDPAQIAQVRDLLLRLTENNTALI